MPVIARDFTRSLPRAFRSPHCVGISINWIYCRRCTALLPFLRPLPWSHTLHARKLLAELWCPIRPAAIVFMTACAVLAAVIKQTLADIFPNRVRPIQPDRVRLLYLDHSETA